MDPVDAGTAVAAADDFVEAIAAAVAGGSSLLVEPDVKWFDEATGELLGVTAVSPPPAAHAGGAGASGAGPAGAVISWTTAGVNRGRVVRGRTFVVPLGAAYYQSDGTLTTSLLTGFSTAAVNLIGAADATFAIWSRPRDGAGGAIFPVTTGTTPDMAAVLRSRRD